MKKLSIIIVSYNTASLLHQCLASVENALTYKNLRKKSEVIVVDNASKDESQTLVKKNYPWVKLICNKKNLGFARANNQGIKIARGKYILLLNSDTRVKNNTFIKLLEAMSGRENIGVVGGKLLNRDNSIQQSMGFFPNLTRVFLWMTFLDDIPILTSLIKPYHITNKKYYRSRQEVDWVTGACFLVRKEVIRTSGLLDEKIFMYGEEVEWCYRIKKNGYQVIYYPQAEIYHDKGASSPVGQIAGIDKEYQAVLYFYGKHKPNWQKIAVKQLLLYGALLRLFLFGIILRNPDKVKSYAKAIKVAG